MRDGVPTEDAGAVARRRLPDRRRSWIQKVKIPDAGGVLQTFYLTVGEYPDGRPGEIFLEAHKEGTFARGVLQALARVTSLAIQSGVPLADVVRTLRHLNFPPRGPVSGSAAVAEATSLPDWIAQELAAAYLPPADGESADPAGVPSPSAGAAPAEPPWQPGEGARVLTPLESGQG